MAMYNPATINATSVSANVIDGEFRVPEMATHKGTRIITLHEAKGGLFPDRSWSANRWDNRTLPWEGIGKDVSHCLTTKEMAELSGVGFKIAKVHGYIEADLGNGVMDYLEMPNKAFFLRVDKSINPDGREVFKTFLLGDGSANMTPIENTDMLALCEQLRQMGFRYENAGIFDQGRITYVSMVWDDNRIVAEEKLSYYVVIVNSFDGSKPFGVYITPVRVVCKNTLALAIKKAERFWKIRHTRNAPFKVDEIRRGLEVLNYYRQGLESHINKAKLLTMDRDAVRGFVNTLFPINESMTQRVIANVERQRSEMLLRYDAPDLIDMEPSVWRVESMLTDYYSPNHVEPSRKTEGAKANAFKNSLGGNAELDRAMGILSSRYDLF